MKDIFLALLGIFRKLIAESVVKKLITDLIMKAVGVAGGLPGMIIGFAVGKLIKFGILKAKQQEVIIEEDKKAVKEQEVYDQVLQDPKSTQEDIANAGTDFLK